MKDKKYILYFFIIMLLSFIGYSILRSDQWAQKKRELANMKLSKITFYTGGSKAKNVELTGAEKDNFMNYLLTSKFYRENRTPKQIKNATDYPETPAKDGDWDLTFGMKMPYTYTFGGSSYALNMGSDYTYQITGSTLTKSYGLPPTATGNLTSREVFNKINELVSKDMAYAIDLANQNKPNWENSFYIPDALTTFSGVNPIQGPSFIILIQGLDLTTPHPISAFSVAGSRVGAARMVVAYTRAGIKYYSYADKAPGGVTIENMYTNVVDAAKAGYAHDTKYMD